MVPTGFGADWQVDLDKRGCVTAAHGYAPDRLREGIGQPLLTALGLASLASGRRGTGSAISPDGTHVPIATDDGQERIHRLSIEPLPDGRFTCLGRDVTNEIRLAARLDAAAAASQAAQDEAAMVAHDRDRVLAALGHDVRTPMNSIMGICSLLLDSELEQEQRIWLERIRASCEALLAMLNGLLEIASGEVGGAGLQVDEVDVIGLVQEVTETLQPQARDKGLELKTRYDDMLRGHWHGRSDAAAPGAVQPCRQRHQVHRQRPRGNPCLGGRRRSGRPRRSSWRYRTPDRASRRRTARASSNVSSAAATKRTPATRASAWALRCAGRTPC